MFQAPRQLPPLPLMLADLPQGHPEKVARHLGVSERTVWAWRAAEQAPRPAMLALFWETQWGRSLANVTAMNEAQMNRQLAGSLQRENDALRLRIARLEATGEFGAANAPTWAVR